MKRKLLLWIIRAYVLPRFMKLLLQHGSLVLRHLTWVVLRRIVAAFTAPTSTAAFGL